MSHQCLLSTSSSCYAKRMVVIIRRYALRLSLFPQSLTDSEHPLNWQRMVGDSVLNTLQCLAIIPYALRS